MHITLKTAAALAAAAVFGAAGADPIYTLGFGAAAGTNYVEGSSYAEKGVTVSFVDPYAAGLVGSGIEAGTCQYGICPDSDSASLGVLNDGFIRMQRSDAMGLSIAGFDAGFIAPTFDFSLTGLIGRILVTGEAAGGSAQASFDLFGLSDVTGTSAFARYVFDESFAALRFTSISFAACLFDGNGDCTPGANVNLAQFALDNVNFIPEPGSFALAGLALAAALGARRRRSA